MQMNAKIYEQMLQNALEIDNLPMLEALGAADLSHRKRNTSIRDPTADQQIPKTKVL